MAYQIGGRFGNSCHEEIATPAFMEMLELLAKNEDMIELPTDRVSLKLTEQIQNRFHAESGIELSDKQAFILMSMMVGVRAPDSDGHASTNLAHTRAEHSNPDDDAQYIHFCRSLNDDYLEGNTRAVTESAALFKEHIKKARHYRSIDGMTFNMMQELYIDYYGLVDLNVNAVAYYAGVAAHSLADSFSHTIRSEADDFKKIIMVMNYVEAIYPDYDAERDGMRHSDGFDDCTDSRNDPVVNAAKQACQEYATVLSNYFSTGDESYLDEFAEKWFGRRDDCYDNYELCHSESWYALAKEDATHAYLECSTKIKKSAPYSLAALIVLLGIAGSLIHRRRT